MCLTKQYSAPYLCADILMQVWAPIVFTCVLYPLAGLQPGFQKYFTFTLFMVLGSLSATSVANMVSCLCVSVEMSSVVLACCWEVRERERERERAVCDRLKS